MWRRAARAERSEQSARLDGPVPCQLPGEVHLVAVASLDELDDGANAGLELAPIEAGSGRPQRLGLARGGAASRRSRRRAWPSEAPLIVGLAVGQHDPGVEAGEQDVGQCVAGRQARCDALDGAAEVVGQVSRPPAAPQAIEDAKSVRAVSFHDLARLSSDDGGVPGPDDHGARPKIGNRQRHRHVSRVGDPTGDAHRPFSTMEPPMSKRRSPLRVFVGRLTVALVVTTLIMGGAVFAVNYVIDVKLGNVARVNVATAAAPDQGGQLPRHRLRHARLRQERG